MTESQVAQVLYWLSHYEPEHIYSLTFDVKIVSKRNTHVGCGGKLNAIGDFWFCQKCGSDEV